MNNNKLRLNDIKVLGHQYSSADNLKKRLNFHDKSNTNGWQKWLFSHIDINSQQNILDIGCGLGELWSQNINRVPVGCSITMYDKSQSILDAAAKNINNDYRFKYFCGDAQSLPFKDGSFNVAMANHMLYHVDVKKTLSEVARVTNFDGTFYATTNGARHMIEMHQLLGFESNAYELPFSIENGKSILLDYFSNIKFYINEVHVSVSDPQSIIDYGLSMTVSQSLTEDQKKKFKENVYKKIEKAKTIKFTKHSGLFVAKDKIPL